ncbi:MAG: hypothetical protein AB7N65_07710 [Vicinamibacterales bacterium]
MLKSVATVTLVFASLLSPASLAHAQTSAATKPGFELLVPSGRVVPTGAQEDDVTRANLTAVQLSYGVRPDLVVTSTVGWARTTPLGLGPQAKLDLFTYDAGIEYRLPRRSDDRRINFKPFTGIGIGARTLSYRHADVATTHNLATYASVGGELGVSRVRVRLEVRDYLTWVTPLGASVTSRRNDISVLAGLRLALR